MGDLDSFKDNAKDHGICSQYMLKWEHCGSKKQLFSMACEIKAIPYMAESISEGWGLSADYICSTFPQFINGQYIYDDGYTSAIWCRPQDKSITISTTAALIVGHNGMIHVPDRICELYIVNSNVTICGEGKALVYPYNSDITALESVEVVIKEKPGI